MRVYNTVPLLLATLALLSVRGAADPLRKAPELIGKASDWLNTGGKAVHLYGPGGLLAPGAGRRPQHVVLLDFWDYTCINCIRTLPYVKAWDAEYRVDGLVVVGKHSPEFAFAHDQANVRKAVARLDIRYPVVNDDAYRNWNAWNNDEWPREILIDERGKVLEDYLGEGDYVQTEAKIRNALSHLHSVGLNSRLAASPAHDDSFSSTDEMYCGYERGAANYLERRGIKRDAPAIYQYNAAHRSIADGMIALSGIWKVTDESLEHVGRNWRDVVAIRYHGPDCNAVLKPEAGQACDVLVFQDNRPVMKADAGADIKYDARGRSYIHVDQPRMYAVTRLAHSGSHTLTLQPVAKGFGLYSFAF